jgi:hypothetical protein
MNLDGEEKNQNNFHFHFSASVAFSQCKTHGNFSLKNENFSSFRYEMMMDRVGPSFITRLTVLGLNAE